MSSNPRKYMLLGALALVGSLSILGCSSDETGSNSNAEGVKALAKRPNESDLNNPAVDPEKTKTANIMGKRPGGK